MVEVGPLLVVVPLPELAEPDDALDDDPEVGVGDTTDAFDVEADDDAVVPVVVDEGVVGGDEECF